MVSDKNALAKIMMEEMELVAQEEIALASILWS